MTEALQEGQLKERSLWKEWNARRLDAKARSEDFWEPVPNGKV